MNLGRCSPLWGANGSRMRARQRSWPHGERREEVRVAGGLSFFLSSSLTFCAARPRRNPKRKEKIESEEREEFFSSSCYWCRFFLPLRVDSIALPWAVWVSFKFNQNSRLDVEGVFVQGTYLLNYPSFPCLFFARSPWTVLCILH